MRANFYIHPKRVNSTLIPTGSGTGYDITLKDDTSLLQPDIVLKWTGSGSPTSYNYVYIPDFMRYYWISNWTYSERCWVASCSVDVLASYKTYIGAAEKYVLRSASESDPLAMDTLYPAKAETTWSLEYLDMTDSAYAGLDLSTGCYIMGVSGANATGSVGGVTYYVLTQAELTYLLANALHGNSRIINNDLPAATDLTEIMRLIGELAYRGTTNIYQFINSLMWVPFPQLALSPTETQPIYLGMVQAGIGHIPYTSIYEHSFGIVLSGITIGSPRWEYVEPYAQYELYWAPFGSIPLDGKALASAGSMNFTLQFDVISGLCRFIYGYSALTPAGEATAMLGVPIALHGQWYDFSSLLAIPQTMAGGIINTALTGLPDIGAVASIASAVETFKPHATGSGRSGGRAGISPVLYITCCRLSHVPEDIPDNGRPLCQIVQINTLSGYVQCADGHLAISCTDGELEQLSDFLTGGFFYE